MPPRPLKLETYLVEEFDPVIIDDRTTSRNYQGKRANATKSQRFNSKGGSRDSLGPQIVSFSDGEIFTQ